MLFRSAALAAAASCVLAPSALATPGKLSNDAGLVFRAADRTLTDDEVNAGFQKIQDELARTTDWAVRK